MKLPLNIIKILSVILIIHYSVTTMLSITYDYQ
ncbi:unnamed protein product [Spodoptera exigua]|nr:unnamed protein product [Spodoptera exigua]